MKFYTNQHKHYCGVDLHTKNMYLCILDQSNKVLLHINIVTSAEAFLKAIEPYREDLVVAAECMFTWYWLADLCHEHNIKFVLGHALYMRAIQGGKAKNDKVDSRKIAGLLKSGMFPMAYVYPQKMRATRDLMRRRNHFAQKRAELFAHTQNTASQYLPDELLGTIAKKSYRANIQNRFNEQSTQTSVETNMMLVEAYDKVIDQLEKEIYESAKVHQPMNLAILQSFPGIGPIIGLTILYEIENINRFKRVQEFVSYARLVKSARESNGKRYGSNGKKIGNAHLKWAFMQAAVGYLKKNPEGQKYLEKLHSKHPKGKALAILAHKIGRVVYYMLQRKMMFNPKQFLTN